MNLTEPQIAALAANRLKLIVVPLEVQPDYVFHSVVDGSVKEMQRTIGENAYGQEQRVTVPFPYTIGERIETPHGNLIVTDVQVKRVQDYTHEDASDLASAYRMIRDLNANYPDAWDRDPWSCFITVERVSE